MSRPTRAIKMVRCATTALLAAIEICNKPGFEYREQTFALLSVNAWEVFLKARIIQQNDGKLQSIYIRKKNSRLYEKNKEGEPRTISLNRALDLAKPDDAVRSNIKGLSLVRNQVAHLGVVSADLQLIIIQYGIASIRNFIGLSQRWFKLSVDLPFFVPVGFVGDVNLIKNPATGKQKILLKVLRDFADSVSSDGSEYAVALKVEVNLDKNLKGGGTIGITNDPTAPEVRISDAEFFERYPHTYNEIVNFCRNSYTNFKQNPRFNSIMRQVKTDINCACERKLNPRNPESTGKFFYNLEATKKRLDDEYK